MSRARRLAATAAIFVCLATFLPGFMAAARADTLPPLTPERSASLQRAIRLWNPLSIGLAKDGLATVTPADGYYIVTFPMGSWLAATGKAAPGLVSAHATADPDGRWHLDTITLPSPIVFGNVMKPGDPPVRVTEELSDQSGSAVIDATLATPSSGDWRCGFKMRVEGQGPTLTVTAEQIREQRDVNPASSGRADFGSIISINGLAAHLPAPGDTAANATSVSIHQIVAATQASNLDLDRLTNLVPHAAAFAMELSQIARPIRLSSEQRTQAHELLDEIRHLADGAKETVTLDNIAVTAGERSGGLEKLVYGVSVDAPDGKGEMRLRLELAGLSLPFLPPGIIGGLIPHRFVLAPSFSGLSMDDVVEVLGKLIDSDDPKPDVFASDVETRLATAPITAGIDELSFDVGPAKLTAKASLTVASPQAIDGKAHIEATGLDDLVKEAGSNPLLKQAVPVLVFLKGVGDTQGDQTVWDIAYHDHALTVNGTDMSALIPGAK